MTKQRQLLPDASTSARRMPMRRFIPKSEGRDVAQLCRSGP